jgi:coenzyme F420-reducing hydrogenase gamma subunit
LNVKVFQFNGCNKCFSESILLKNEADFETEYITNPLEWKEEKMDIAVITGFLLPENQEILNKISKNSDRMIAYGDCTTTGGIFGLAKQRGHDVKPIRKLGLIPTEINGCLGEVEELISAIKSEEHPKLQNLCKVCARKSTCDYLDEVHRQINLDEDPETCFNDQGFLCSGYIALECKERCIDYGTQCRGCKPMVDRSGIRMLGMFGTLMGNIEVATEASKYGATDKLADKDDDITESLPDIVGNFFRFTLPISGLPRGKISSNGNILEDIFLGRLIEEIPLITGLLGGTKSISLTLNIIETYEKGANIEVSEKTKKYRKELKTLENDLQSAFENQDADKYKEITDKIRKIAGNMNLSNIFFGGFKTSIDEDDKFEDYKTHIFEVVEGTYKNGSIEFSIDSKGVINEIKIKED